LNNTPSTDLLGCVVTLSAAACVGLAILSVAIKSRTVRDSHMYFITEHAGQKKPSGSWFERVSGTAAAAAALGFIDRRMHFKVSAVFINTDSRYHQLQHCHHVVSC